MEESELSDAQRTSKMNEDQEYSQDGSKTTYKSFKKKYRKMRHEFEKKMAQSNTWYKQEQEAIETARRLALENDGLLDLLLDTNTSFQIPEHQRIDISTPGPLLAPLPPLLPAPSTTEPTPQGEASYQKLLSYLTARQATAHPPPPPKSLAGLMASVPHRPFTIDNKPPTAYHITSINYEMARDLDMSPDRPEPVAWLSNDAIEAYLNKLDDVVAGKESEVEEKPKASERDLIAHNPVSVYNWLRVHKPEIFLQDDEPPHLQAKALSKPGALRGAGKRAAMPAPRSDAVEFVEEDGLGYDPSVSGHKGKEKVGGKRKRGDDVEDKPKRSSKPVVKKAKRKEKGEGAEATPRTSGRGGARKKKSEEVVREDVDMEDEELVVA